MTRRTLTPVTITERYLNFAGTRRETWAAVSKDGQWKYRRLEISGTPWEIEYVPTGEQGDWYSSLPRARASTADGSALAYIEARRKEVA